MAQEPNHIDAAIADLEVWLDRISAAIDTLRSLRAQGGALPAGLPPQMSARAKNADGISHDAFFQMTVPDAAEKYLKLVKATKPNTELAEDLLKGGLKSSSQNFAEMVRSVLSRDGRFVRVNAEWGLGEWYPPMRKRSSVETKRTELVSKDEAKKKERTSNGFSQTSMKGRALQLLDSQPEQLFNAATVAEQTNEQNIPSVTTALAGLFKGGFILRPRIGYYQSKKAA